MQTTNPERKMTYKVELEVFQGAEFRPRTRTAYLVEESAPLSAMAKAEQHLNVQLPPDQYAVARYALPRFLPRPVASVAMPLAAAA